MKAAYITLCTAALATALPSCSVASFQEVLPSYATILSAVPVANGSTYGEGAADIGYPTNPTNLPENCALIVNVTTSSSSSFRFGIFLPTQWNGRFLAVGNGGFAGGINWLDMGAGIRYGFAVASTDTGHNATTSDGTWALNDPETREDWGYRAIHGTTVWGKALTEAFYGQNISYSYYSGASTGGRQGLREAQLDPKSFDGLLIGAPAWWTSHLQTWTTKLGSYNLPVNSSNRIPLDKFALIGAEVIEKCDGLDGVVDGIVSAPDKCKVTDLDLRCTSTKLNLNASSCLREEQMETLKNIYADYYAEGKFAFPGLYPGSEAQWEVLLGGEAPNNLGDEYIQDFLLNDPSWDWPQYTDSLVWEADAVDPGNATADNYQAMLEVQKQGSKIFMFHGMSDGLIATRSSNVFYDRVAKLVGTSMNDWFRLFLVPGMQHVSGTAVDAPYYFAQPNAAGDLGTDIFSTPGFEDPQHDALMALMKWVEEGQAPDQIIATTWANSTDASSGVLRQRPLCPWPQTAVYNGTGNVNSAQSWDCSS
ncbi:hypothetical protein N0V93_002929 [Gnomoniopsis smithogilvyi]|uniref:Carboxylic ester hydrolase n=1 Tax=Gnomoniopsis smithogilvyi TaxID=1191159 RepID=A0A9W8YXD2_9PEZI|nr:hypothetical protein N0V93_002929 [Gnomoniopsis smithogilvyi]